MARVVAISGGDLNSTKALNKYSIKLSGKSNANVLFIGTASEDAPPYILNFTSHFQKMGCNVKSLCLVTNTYTDSEVDELLSWADIIYVGGGDTVSMMKVWRECGLDVKLCEVYEKDTAVLTGISAGAICWFACGHSDSESFYKEDNWQYIWAENMLDIYHMAFCPHYNEEGRKSFDVMLKEKGMTGLAMENDTAFVEEHEKQYFIRADENAKAYILEYQNEELSKKEVSFHTMEIS